MACQPRTGAPAVAFVVKGTGADAHPGIVDGLERMISDGTLRSAVTLSIDPRISAEKQTNEWRSILARVDVDAIEYVVLHHLHSPRLLDCRRWIERIQALPHRPLVALTNGDPFFGIRRPSFPRMFVQAARTVDVIFSTSMGVSADYLARRTSRPISLLPNGVCQARFGDHFSARPSRPEFRVAFIGSNNRSRNPLSGYHWFARRRESLVRALSKRFGDDFALFGRGWEGIREWRGPVPFKDQQEACRRAEVIVGGVPFSPARYYLSNRPFIQIASGVPFIDLSVDGVQNILRDGEHWFLAKSVDEIADRCDDLLSRSASWRTEFGVNAAEYVYSHHTQEERTRSLMSTMIQVRKASIAGGPRELPDLRYLLPEVDRVEESAPLTRHW
jgi:hypothetical protein